MKKYITLLFIIFTSNMYAQNKIFETQPDPKEQGNKVLVGDITIQNIEQEASCAWFEKGLIQYKADSTTITSLKKLIANYTFTVVIGTWCEDSQKLFPELIKCMQACNYDFDNMTIIGVDRKKQSLNIDHILLNIEKVPTIIIRKGPKEIGRIIETINKENIETELLYYLERDKELGEY